MLHTTTQMTRYQNLDTTQVTKYQNLDKLEDVKNLNVWKKRLDVVSELKLLSVIVEKHLVKPVAIELPKNVTTHYWFYKSLKDTYQS